MTALGREREIERGGSEGEREKGMREKERGQREKESEIEKGSE